MSRNTGTFDFAANFEGLLKAPIDARQLVNTYADLTGATTWNASGNIWLYNGAIVVVGNDPIPAKNGIYWLRDADNYQLSSNWVKVAEGSGISLTGATNGLTINGQRISLGGVLTGDTTFSGGLLKYSTPQTFTDDSQIVDRGYVNSVALGLDPKLAVDVATISNITLSGLTTVDGISLVNGDRVLVKNQISGETNGIYVASASTWTRATDFDASGETVQGSLIPVISGLTQGNTIWVLITPDPITPDVTPMEFTLFSTVTMIAGNSIIISGSTISVDISTGTLNTALNDLQTTKLNTTVFNTYTGTSQTILNLALTGATNGLSLEGRKVTLGGSLTGDTTIDTSAGKLIIGISGKTLLIDSGPAVLIGDETASSNFICTSPSTTKISSGIGDLCFNSDNIIVDGVNLNYLTHPTTWSCDTQLVDKKYVDDFVSGGSLYNCASPATVSVGGITAGTVLTGKTTNQILNELLVPYLSPAFSSFSSTGVPATVEVGCSITGLKAFAWVFTNGSNVQGSTMCIRDVTSGVTLGTDISISSPQSVAVANKTFTACGQQQTWCGSAKNTCIVQFNSAAYTTTAYLPYYYGKCTCPGPSGSGRPTGTSAMVLTGTKVLATSAGDVTIAYNSTADDYLWFAIPSSVTNKNCWCCNASIYGTIGGAVSPGGNLFPAPDYENISVTTACWTANYDIYISNKQSIAGTLKMGNV